MNSALFSVVTVVYNASLYIEKTIESIVNQSSEKFEYIVIDGNSTDGTLDIIERYRDRINIFISEKDGGIYDAMNKAIQLANGKWIIFINAGDSFASYDVLQKIESHLSKYATDVLYGNAIYKYDFGIRYMKAHKIKSLDDFRNGLPFCHQCVLVRTEILKNSPFDLSYKIAADYDMFYRLYSNGCTFEYLDMPVSEYLVGGYSDQNSIRLFKEIQRIRKNKANLLYFYHFMKLCIRGWLRSIIPVSLISYYRNKRYQNEEVTPNKH